MQTATKMLSCLTSAVFVLAAMGPAHAQGIEAITRPSEDVTLSFVRPGRIAAVLVKEGDDMVGIWTERDYLRNSSDPDFKPQAVKVGDYMSSPLHFANHDANLTQLEEMFLGLYLRHLPVQKDGSFIGMISIGDVLRANLLEKDSKIKELNSLASWQYYENWGWDRK